MRTAFFWIIMQHHFLPYNNPEERSSHIVDYIILCQF